MKTIIIDATGATLGRLASYSAKQSILGKEVIVVNCDKAIITGRPRMSIKEYQLKKGRGGSSQKGPNFPRSPERIVKRTVRGMLSYKQGRGEAALDRIKCYNHVPTEFENSEKIKMEENKKIKTMTLKELSREI